MKVKAPFRIRKGKTAYIVSTPTRNAIWHISYRTINYMAAWEVPKISRCVRENGSNND